MQKAAIQVGVQIVTGDTTVALNGLIESILEVYPTIIG
jgi:hydrogenase maturation factor